MQGIQDTQPTPVTPPVDKDVAVPEPKTPEVTETSSTKELPTTPAPESDGLDISLSPQITLSNVIPQAKPLHPDVVNNIANTAELASSGLVPKDVTAGTVNQYGPEAVRDQFAVQKQQAQINAQMNQAQQAAAVGNVDKTEYHVKQAQDISKRTNNGAMEDYAVNDLVKGTDKQFSVTADQAKKVQYLKNIQLELQNKYENESTGQKIGEFLLNAIPLSYNIAVSGTGDPNNGTLKKLYEEGFDPTEYAAVNAQKLLSLPYDQFVNEVGRLQEQIKEKSKTFGIENTSLQQQVFNGMLAASNTDRVMDQVFTVLDVTGVGQLAGGAAKGVVKGVTKAASKITKGAKTAQKVIETAATNPEVALHSGALTTTAKQVGQSDKVATKVVQAVNTGKSNALVPSTDAAYKNLAPMHEPLSIRDSTSAQALNLDSFFRGAGSKLAEYQDDRMIAELVNRLKEVQTNRSFTPIEMEDALTKVRLNYANDNIDFHLTAEHHLNPSTLEPIIKARITQSAGEGWDTAEAADKFIKENFNIKTPYNIEQDVTGKHIVLVDHGLDDFATMQNIEMKKPGPLMRVINQIYYGANKRLGGGESRKGSKFSVVNQMGTIPEAEYKSGITALTSNLDILKVKTQIYKRNIESLPTSQVRDLTAVADYYRDIEASEWPSIQTVSDNWRTITGKDATEHQLRAWNDYKLLNDFDYTMSNLAHRNLLKDGGYVQLKLNTENAELTNPLARPINNYSDFQVPHLYDVDGSAFRNIESEEDFLKMQEKGYTFHELGDYVKIPVNGEKQRIAYVMSRTASVDDLPELVLPYRAGGRIQYAGQWFAKQPNIQEVIIKGEARNLTHPPITHAIGESRLEIERFVEKTNKAIRKYKDVESIKKQGKIPSPKSIDELNALWKDTRWQSLDNFLKDVKEGSMTLHELEAVGDRQKLKLGEKYAKESTGRLSSEDNDLEVMFNLSRRGERKLDPTGAPAKLKSPFITLDEAINRDIKKLTFQKFVGDASERWHKTFKEDLVDAYANPVNAIIHGTFKKAADPTRQALGRRYQSWLRNLARLGFSDGDAQIESMAKMCSYYERMIEGSEGISKDFARAKYGINKWWKSANASTFFRGLMFQSTFGLWNFKEVFVQSTQAAIILGSEILQNPARGLKATAQWGKGLTEEATHAVHDSRLLGLLLARSVDKDVKYLDEVGKSMGHATKPSQLFKDYQEAGIDSIQRYFGQSEAQDYVKPLPSILEKSSDLLAKAKQGKQALSESGQIFFNAGTKIGNYAGYTVARLRLIKKFEKQYGKGMIDIPDSAVRREYLRDLRFETERLTFAQSRASNLTIQQAHNEFGFWGFTTEMMTQYMQFNMKLLTAILPKSLGGSSAYSVGEKIGMSTTIAALSGSAFLPFHNGISSELYLEFKKRGWFTGSADDWQNSTVNQGLLNTALNSTLGLKGDQKVTFGTQFSPWSQIEDMMDVWVGDKPMNVYVGGPMMSKLINAWEAVGRYNSLRTAMQGQKADFMDSYGVGALIAAVESSVGSAAAVNRLLTALKSDKIMSKSGFAVARSNDTAAWLNFVGITANPYEALEFYRDISDKYKAQVNDLENTVRNLVVQRTELVNENKFDKAEQVDNAISTTLSLIPANERGQFVKGMIRNFNHPSMEYQRQRLQKEVNYMIGGH